MEFIVLRLESYGNTGLPTRIWLPWNWVSRGVVFMAPAGFLKSGQQLPSAFFGW